MARGVLISADNTLQAEGGSGIQNIKISGALNVVGDVLTGTDSRPISAGGLMPTGSAASGSGNGFTGWDVAHAATGGVTWSQSYPTSWLQVSVSFGYIPLGATNLNVRWETQLKKVNVIAGGSNNVVTISPQVDNLLTAAAGAQNVMMHQFNVLQNADIHNADAIFGEVSSIVIQRLGSDGADTETNAQRITNVNTVRNILA